MSDEKEVTLRKFSKDSNFYKSTKIEFFENNSRLLNESLEINKLYLDQPIQILCKICAYKLPIENDFTNHLVPYVFCISCSHLNGRFQESPEFLEKLYVEDADDQYAKDYLDSNYMDRTINIYKPKLDFLLEVLGENIRILDIGCGAGYFVHAALQQNISAEGIDVSATMVEFGNENINHSLKMNPLRRVGQDEFLEEIRDTKANVISAIGVLEHISNLQDLFEAFKSSNARYLYYLVPMYSLSAAIENVFPNIFPRALSGGHTHLFTEKSILKMNELLGTVSIGEWRFGTDFLDLYRSISVSLKLNGASEKMLNFFEQGFAKSIDSFQAINDRAFFTSEIHCLIEKDG